MAMQASTSSTSMTMGGDEAPFKSSKATSCNECRRLKLKCSKTPWPCDMCVKRRLAHLCPDGVQKREKAKQGAVMTVAAPSRSASSSDGMHHQHVWNGSEPPVNVSAVWSRLSSVEQKLDLLLADRGLPSSSSRASTSGLHDLANVASDYSRISREAGEESPERQHGLLALHPDGRSSYVGPHAHSVYLAREGLQSTSRAVSPTRAIASRPGSPTPVDYDSVAATAPATAPTTQAQPDDGSGVPAGTSPMDTLTPSLSDSNASLMAWSTPGFRSPHSSTAIWNHLRPMLPSKDTAQRLVDVYYASVSFMHEFVPRHEMDKDIWPVFYGNGGQAHTDSPPDGFHAHKMALLFAILALGVLLDVKRPQRDPVGRALYSCGWNAMVLANFTESTSLDALLALVHLALYLTWRRAGRYSESAWPLFGVMTSMMTRAGLHRDPGHFGLKESELERRRRVFWDLHGVEVLRALAFCRPPAIREGHVDTRFPTIWTIGNTEEHDRPSSAEAEACAFHAAKCLQTQLVNRILDDCLCATSTYPTTMEYDARIRQLFRSFPVWMSPDIRTLTHRSTKGKEDMEKTYHDERARNEMLHTMRTHLTHLNTHQLRLLLHRGWFSEALQRIDAEKEGKARLGGIKRFQQSVDAVNQTASKIIELVASVWSHYPALVIRWMFFWNGLFSAAVCRGLFAVKQRRGGEAHAAWRDLRLAIALLRLAVDEWKPLEQPLGILLRLDRRAEMALGSAAGTPGVDAVQRSTGEHGEEDMDLIGDREIGRRSNRTAKRSTAEKDEQESQPPASGKTKSGKRVRMKQDEDDDNIGDGDAKAQSAAPVSQFTGPQTASAIGADLYDSLQQNSDGATLDYSLFSPHDLTMPAFLPSFMLGDINSTSSTMQGDVLPMPGVSSGPSSFAFSAATAALHNGEGDSSNGNASNSAQLIQMISAGVGWDDVTSWDNAIFDL